MFKRSKKTIANENIEVEFDQTYYFGITDQKGLVLKEALHNIIKDHKELSYKDLWEALKETEKA